MACANAAGRAREQLVIGLLVLQTGCAAFISSKVNNAADNLTTAIQNQDDPELVRDGAPAYLLLMDSLVEGSPDNGDILEAAATLYSAYAAVFVVDPTRAAILSRRAKTTRAGRCALARERCAVWAICNLTKCSRVWRKPPTRTFPGYSLIVSHGWSTFGLTAMTGVRWLIWQRSSLLWTGFSNLTKAI